MCTPTSHKLSFSLRIESASSKSLASFGSMVKVVTLRKSSRLAISSAVISAGINVGQAEFRQDGMHLGCVIPCFS